MSTAVSTLRRISMAGAVYRSEADELQLDLAFVEAKYPESEIRTHFLEVNRRRLTMESELINERDAAANNVARGLCGCGGTSSHRGRCWFRRQQAEKRNGAGPVKPKAKPAVTRKAEVKPANPGNGSSIAVSLKQVIADLNERRAQLDITIAACEEALKCF